MGEHHQNSQTVQKNVTKRWNAREKLGTIFHRKTNKKIPEKFTFCCSMSVHIFTNTVAWPIQHCGNIWKKKKHEI
jgi:hypothetical protein